MVNLVSARHSVSTPGWSDGNNLRHTSTVKHGLQLTMYEHIGIAPDRRCKVSVEGRVEGVMPVFRNVKHSSAEVLGALCSLE